ncbi:MAG: CDP-diacylglycerol--glycerol-3-phosphate 3-phosphatidyltransferase [Rickettsiales bacterium TMED289]|nr:MAG: CDP-diacylglycerol--glycerol-3-phosphate 3-phosphatidyltransferase [Rickettsiales bacterium TMED289]
MIVNILNAITLSRILCAILIYFFLFLESQYLLALLLFGFASFTDFLDGYVARKTNNESVLGEILDPIADKLLIVFVLIGLSVNLDSFLIGFISAVIISREVWVAALRDINARDNQSDKTKVTFLAKTKTAIQMFAILMYLFGLTLNNMMVLFFADIILIIALLVTIQTGFQYTISTFKK